MTDNRDIPSNSSPSTTPSDHRASLAGEPPTPRVAMQFDWTTSAYRLAVVGLLAFIAYTMKTGTISADAWVRGIVDVEKVSGEVNVNRVRDTVKVSQY
jgi:hypothetical protein